MSATFLPEELPADAASSEKEVFRALQETLGDGWTVVHSARWMRLDRNKNEQGEADFLLVHPEKGFLVLEVKGGTIRFDPAKDRWTTETESSRISVLPRGPVDQADRSRFHFKRVLRQGTPKGKPILPHGIGVVLPDMWNMGGLVLPGLDPSYVATAKRLKDLGSWAEETLAAQAPDMNLLDPKFGKLQAQRLVDLVAPRVYLRPQLAAEVSKGRDEIRRMTAEQADILAHFDTPRMLVTGGAGTGKTVVAAERAVTLARSGARTLLTCFNRSLATWLNKRMKAILAPSGDVGMLGDRLVIRNLHDWAVEVTGKEPGEQGAGSDFWDRILPEAAFDKVTSESEPPFDAVVVDEAQDFSDNWWTVIEALSGEGGFLWVFQDPNQAIYAASPRFPKDLLRLNLTRNFRNTQAIHDAFQRFYDGPEFAAAGPEGRAVSRVTGVASADLAGRIGKLLATLVDEEALTVEQIVVLSPIRKDSAVLNEEMLGRFPTCSPSNPRKGAIAVDTIHSFKGLERPVVILCEMDRCYAGTRDELHYVGMSRAVAHLVVVETVDA